MIRLLPLALLSAVLAFPAGAEAACGVPAAGASFETPEVQVHPDGHQLTACYRPTGHEWWVGYRWDPNDDAFYGVVDILGGRWLHMFNYSGGDDYDHRSDELVDLREGTTITAARTGENFRQDVAVLPGALVTAGGDGVVARFSDEHSEVLDTTQAHTLARSGARLYWKTAAGVRTAVLALPQAEPARALPPARRLGRCRPRTGARLVRYDGLVVVTRKGSATYACSNGRTRLVGTAVTDVQTLWDRKIAYARPGISGLLDIVSGKRRELESSGSPVATAAILFAGSPTGLRMWRASRPAPKLIAPGPATDVALDDEGVYWMDASGAPRFRAIG